MQYNFFKRRHMLGFLCHLIAESFRRLIAVPWMYIEMY